MLIENPTEIAKAEKSINFARISMRKKKISSTARIQ